MDQIFKVTKETEVSDEAFDSGLTDAKGRKIGYRIIVKELEWAETDNFGYFAKYAKKFSADTTTTRDGNGFGAYVRPVRSDTLEGVMKLAHKRRDASFKRAAKKAA